MVEICIKQEKRCTVRGVGVWEIRLVWWVFLSHLFENATSPSFLSATKLSELAAIELYTFLGTDGKETKS